MKNQFWLQHAFFLQMQKASSKTSFGLNKFYLRISSSLQILTLLSFIFWFSKWNWRENWNHFLLWWCKKYWSFAELLMNMSSLMTMQQDTPFLKWSIKTEFSVLPPAVCDINFQWHRISGWIKYCWMWVAISLPMRPYQLLGRMKSCIGNHRLCVSGFRKWDLLDITLEFIHII